MDPQNPTTPDFKTDVIQALELANQQTWKDTLSDLRMKLSVEFIPEKKLTQEDKDTLCNVLLQQMVQASKNNLLEEKNVASVATFITSHVESAINNRDIENFLYMLSSRWDFFTAIPNILYDQSEKSSREQIAQLAQGALAV